MKVFAVIFFGSLALAAVKALPVGDEMEIFRALAQRCKTEAGATDDDIEAVLTYQPPSSKEAKCMRACLLKEFAIMSDDGKFVKENAMKVAEVETKGDPEKMAVASEIADACKDIAVSDDHCEAAAQYVFCLVAEAKNRGLTKIDF